MKTETTRQIIGDKEGEEVGLVRGRGEGGREGTGYTAVEFKHARRCGGGELGLRWTGKGLLYMIHCACMWGGYETASYPWDLKNCSSMASVFKRWATVLAT